MGELDTYRREVGGSIRLGKVGRAHLQPRSLPRLDSMYLPLPPTLYVGMTALTAHLHVSSFSLMIVPQRDRLVFGAVRPVLYTYLQGRV